MSILTLSALLNTLKIPVNGYHLFIDFILSRRSDAGYQINPR